MKTEIAGVVRTWGLTKDKREYIVVENTFGVARHIYKSDPYSALTGKGEQRGVVPNHARKLRKEMEAGTFTPTPVHVGIRPKHARAIVYKTVGGVRTASLTLEEGDTLPLTNGGHRFQALADIREDAEKKVKGAKTDKDRDEAQAFLDLVDAQPIVATLLLNGSTQDDFVNLQKGKVVDAAHMLSLKIARGMAGDKDGPAMKLAFQVAKLLSVSNKSPFYKQIRFDSKGMAPLLISTLCSKGSSDLGTSLVGLAKVGMSFEPKKDADWLVFPVIAVAKTLRDKARELLDEGRVLTPPPDGTKGSATMLVGLAVALAYRMGLEDEEIPGERARACLVEAARETLDCNVNGNFSGPAKRKLLGEFTRAFFADMAGVEKHEGLPVGLLKALSPSAFGASPLPKKPKEATARAQAAPAEKKTGKALPDVDGPLPDAEQVAA